MVNIYMKWNYIKQNDSLNFRVMSLFHRLFFIHHWQTYVFFFFFVFFCNLLYLYKKITMVISLFFHIRRCFLSSFEINKSKKENMNIRLLWSWTLSPLLLYFFLYVSTNNQNYNYITNASLSFYFDKN